MQNKLTRLGFFRLNDRLHKSAKLLNHKNRSVLKKEAQTLLASFKCRYSLKYFAVRSRRRRNITPFSLSFSDALKPQLIKSLCENFNFREDARVDG